MGAFARNLRTLAAGFCLVASPLAGAVAQPQPNIAIPTPPGGLIAPPTFDGCYGVTQDLYGPYRLDFCLTQFGGGSYQVYGGITCQGTLNWQLQPGQANIQLNYTNCSGGMSWSPDKMACVIMYYPPSLGPGVDPRVAIPTPTPQSALQCTYQPSVPGYPPVMVWAERRYY